MSDGAFESALKALRHRDRSSGEIEEWLAERGFPLDERTDALERLARTALVDDTRFARARAASLSDRGWGDERIRHALLTAGVGREQTDEALAALAPEAERARRIVERRGRSPKVARYLNAHGFAPDIVADAVAGTLGEPLR